jgi:hypothetical protein
VTSAGNRSVTKLRASDGAKLGTFSVASRTVYNVGGLAFDGTSIWVTVSKDDFAEGFVVKLSLNGTDKVQFKESASKCP